MTPSDFNQPWDNATAETMARNVFDHGWTRVNTFAGLALLYAAMQNTPIPLERLAEIGNRPNLDGSCWEPLDLFTDESLAQLRAEYGDEDDTDTAAEVNAQMRADRAQAIADADRYAQHCGTRPIRTCRDAIALLIAAGALIGNHDGTLVRPANPIPRVADVLPVSDEERAVLDKMAKDAR